MTKNILINKQLARRDFMKGLAGLGLLSALQVEKAFAQTRAPVRVCFIPLAHGWGSGNQAIDNFSGSEFDFELPEFWSPFEAIKADCVFVDGLRGTFWGNAHDVSYSDILTSAVPIDAPNESALGGPFPKPIAPSIDFLLEKHYNMPALRLSARYTSWGASYHPLSFNDRLDSLAYYTRSYDAYRSVFSGGTSGGGNTQTDPVVAELFPYLTTETNQIIQNINATNTNERNKLYSYLEAVNAVGKKVGTQPVTSGTATLKRIPTQSQNIGLEMESMLDMVRVAFTNDTHRVAVVGLGEQTDEFAWTDTAGKAHNGISGYTGDFHHDIAHYNEGKPADARRAYVGWTQYNAQKVVNFVKDLQNTIDIDGRRLIDNTIIVLTGEVGNGTHDRDLKPHVVIGGGGRISGGTNAIRTGRWYKTPLISTSSVGSRDSSGAYKSIKQTTSWANSQCAQFSHADLFTRIAQLSGLNISSVGIDRMNLSPLSI
ncbi:MAG: DUF1552 domain-containing protein [Cellvibrio sp.]